MTEPGAPADLAALWLAQQQRLVVRAAHDVKNALNGVAVNVEVVRARTARGAAGDQVASFAATAAEQLEEAVSLVEALLAIARPARAAADAGGVAGVLRGVAPLFAAAAHPLDVDARGSAPTPALDGEMLRTLVTGALLSVVEDVAPGERPEPQPIRCVVEPDQSGGTRVHIAGARPATLSTELARLADRAGVLTTSGPHGIELTIPALETV